MKERYVERLY